MLRRKNYAKTRKNLAKRREAEAEGAGLKAQDKKRE